MGVAQTIVPTYSDKDPNARKLGQTAENVVLGGEFLDEPGTCYVEITTNTGGLILKYKLTVILLLWRRRKGAEVKPPV